MHGKEGKEESFEGTLQQDHLTDRRGGGRHRVLDGSRSASSSVVVPKLRFNPNTGFAELCWTLSKLDAQVASR